MAKTELLGTEGGLEYVILIAFKNPWSLYFTVKTPWVLDRMLRLRIELRRGWPLVQIVAGRRYRCSSCRSVVEPWRESCCGIPNPTPISL